MNPNFIPQNPVKELDELYVKDDKILVADCEQITVDYFKEKDDERFHAELQQLTQELQQLDEGKLTSQHIRGHHGMQTVITTTSTRSSSGHGRQALFINGISDKFVPLVLIAQMSL
jgi:hypothetical protein